MHKYLQRAAEKCAIFFCLLDCFAVGSLPAAEALPPSEKPAEDYAWPFTRAHEREFRRQVPGWIRDLDSADAERQEVAIRFLFGKVPGAPFGASPRIIRVLANHGIAYHSADARASALSSLGYHLMEKPKKLVPLIRDGLNDPHPAVRATAIADIHQLLTFPPRKLAERYREQVLDLLISKGLTDENEDVATLAFDDLQIQHIAPTRAALRALDRVIATKRAHKSVRGYLPQTRADWARKLPPPQPPAAPKPRRAKPAPPPQVPRFPLPVG